MRLAEVMAGEGKLGSYDFEHLCALAGLGAAVAQEANDAALSDVAMFDVVSQGGGLNECFSDPAVRAKLTVARWFLGVAAAKKKPRVLDVCASMIGAGVATVDEIRSALDTVAMPVAFKYILKGELASPVFTTPDNPTRPVQTQALVTDTPAKKRDGPEPFTVFAPLSHIPAAALGIGNATVIPEPARIHR